MKRHMITLILLALGVTAFANNVKDVRVIIDNRTPLPILIQSVKFDRPFANAEMRMQIIDPHSLMLDAMMFSGFDMYINRVTMELRIGQELATLMFSVNTGPTPTDEGHLCGITPVKIIKAYCMKPAQLPHDPTTLVLDYVFETRF